MHKKLFRDDHHVFMDMFVLLDEHPALFKLVADKEAQYVFFAARLAGQAE